MHRTQPDRVVSPDVKNVRVPASFIVYKCKISGGRVLEIPLPYDLTQEDATRLHKFFLAMADDVPGRDVG